MHCQRSNSFLPLTALLAALAGQASSQALRDSIVGCADVACPDRPHDIYPNCTLVDTSFNDIGLARIPGPLGSSRGLSWVQANAMDTSVFGRANVTKRFYFGQPPDLDLSNTGACALFFTEVSDRVKFNNSDVRLSQGTCDQAMPPACVGAITRRADNFDFAGLSGQDACSKLQSEFEQNLDNECAGIALGSQWSGLVSKALSGAGSPKPITAQENATSNCWPITPKSESLAFVHGMESIVPVDFKQEYQAYFTVTPILTVFFDDKRIVLRQTQLTCMKPVALGVAASATMIRGGSEHLRVGYQLLLPAVVGALLVAMF